ncbi:MAG: translocation/assembly module TamB domain-containing protein, partial [Bacteroidota bacterium]|nr:translocation/assembly module TamB domain-containing protein [Bacteroidota bacterium]
GFVLDYLNTHYNFSDYVDFRKNSIQFDKIEIFDTRNEKAVVTGELSHNYFRDFTMDINIDASNFTLLNTSESENSIYYGKAYGSGNVAISGSFELVDIEIDMKTEKGTDFSIPLSTGSEISESNFITFINTNSEDNTEEEEIADLSGVSLKMDLEVTPDAEVQLIFASKMGDIIKGKGTSNLKLEISANHEFNMYGDYYIEEGEYTLSIGDFLSKHFIVKPGGSISWNGDPYDANINLETYYKLNAALQDLYLDSSEVYRKRVPVECQIHMTNDLMNPDIKFAIDLPKSSESDRAQLRNLPSDELNKQFISLLFINRFQPLPGLDFGNAVNFSSGYSLSESTSELLSNQLSHWLSQISNDFDIGFAYRPGDEVSSDEVEVALETQFFNQRLTVNGNVGMGGQYENTNSMVGDVEANLKLNEAGKLRVKAFRRSNTNFDYEKGPTTQGVGVFYREEFDTFADLMRKLLKLNQDKE